MDGNVIQVAISKDWISDFQLFSSRRTHILITEILRLTEKEKEKEKGKEKEKRSVPLIERSSTARFKNSCGIRVECYKSGFMILRDPRQRKLASKYTWNFYFYFYDSFV